MTSKFYISLAFILSLTISNIIAAPLLVAAIDFSIHSKKQENSSHSEKKQQPSTKAEVSVSPYNAKHKVVPPKKNEKLIQGYRTTRDRNGNDKTEYVYGVIKKGKNNLYTGYLYGKENKQTFVYGDPSTGSMQEQNQGTISVDAEMPDAQ